MLAARGELQQVDDSEFMTGAPTLAAGNILGNTRIVQVRPDALPHLSFRATSHGTASAPAQCPSPQDLSCGDHSATVRAAP